MCAQPCKLELFHELLAGWPPERLALAGCGPVVEYVTPELLHQALHKLRGRGRAIGPGAMSRARHEWALLTAMEHATMLLQDTCMASLRARFVGYGGCWGGQGRIYLSCLEAPECRRSTSDDLIVDMDGAPTNYHAVGLVMLTRSVFNLARQLARRAAFCRPPRRRGLTKGAG